MSSPVRGSIFDIEIYIPGLCVEHSDLEVHDGVAEGKYTKGFGQHRMAFCTDREDAASLALTVVNNLLEKRGLGK